MDRREALKQVALLVGGALSAPAVAGVLGGCQPAAAAPALQQLTANQRALVTLIAEHIIPTTDTPGAAAVGVPAFIARMLAEWYPEDERRHFLAGLAEVDRLARQQGGRPFRSLTPGAQVKVLKVMDQRAYPVAVPLVRQEPGDVREKSEGGGEDPLSDPIDDAGEEQMEEPKYPPFFRTMKELTLLGYYLSEVGATQELRYEPIPGRYEGCVPFDTIGRTWTV